jgi:hypothetical protein
MYQQAFGIKNCNDFFYTQRFHVKCRGLTRAEFLMTPLEILPNYVERYINKNKDKKNNEYSLKNKCYDIYYGSVCNFRPSQAIKLYQYLNVKSILDPCAGFGGRCFAAMELNLNYYGFDTNSDLKQSFDGMISKYKKDSQIKIFYEDSSKADFSKLNYDCLFTSPPYSNREIYPNMPNYKNKKDFIINFIKPLLLNGYKYLQDGGFLCLNIPEAIYKNVEKIFRSCDDKIIYEATSRKIGNCETKKEFIYIWKKPNI